MLSNFEASLAFVALVVIVIIAILAADHISRECRRGWHEKVGGAAGDPNGVLLVSVEKAGGAACATDGGLAPRCTAREVPTSGGADPRLEAVANARHPMGVAIREYARGLAVGDALSHPLDRDDYTAGVAGGSVSKPSKKPKKPWSEYATWDELQKDEGAVAAYLAQRAAAITNPDFDWGPVLAAMQPKLAENREYIGVANVSKDGRTLHLTQSEASPTAAGETDSDTAFASIPAALVESHGSRPGLFLFHTHPDDLRCCQFPSSHDLAAAIDFGAAGRFAANAVISRYGVFVYGIDWGVYKAIKRADDPELAKLHYSHDVVAAHESTRSWSAWTIPEYLGFYPRHRMFINSYPTSKLVGDFRHTFLSDLEMPVDHALIADHVTDITSHQKGRARRRTRDKWSHGATSKRTTDDRPSLDFIGETKLGFD